MTQRFLVIHSLVDVITNSSTELFVSVSEKAKEFFEEVTKDSNAISDIRSYTVKELETYWGYNRNDFGNNLNDDTIVIGLRVERGSVDYNEALELMLNYFGFKYVD